MRKELRSLIVISLIIGYAQQLQSQCAADAGTLTLVSDGNGNIPRVVCYGDAIELNNNGDYVLPPAAPGQTAGIMLAIFSCPPSNPNDLDNDPCWTGWYWTGESFDSDNLADIQNAVGVNHFWFAPVTADDASGTDVGHDSDGDGCYEVGINQAYEFWFLDEIQVMNTTSNANLCTGTATFTISGGSPIFRTEPAESLGGNYTVINTGAGTLTTSGANQQIVTITGLTNGSAMSFTITDPNGCSLNFSEIFDIPNSDPSFTVQDFCQGQRNRATNIASASPIGRFSFNPVPNDGATINPLTGEISNGIAGTTYFVQYTTNGPCPVTSAPQPVRVLPLLEPPTIPANQQNITICNGESFVVTPSGGSTYNLYSNALLTTLLATGPEFDVSRFVTPGTTATLYITTEGDPCDSAPTSIRVTIVASPPPVINPNTVRICRGESITIAPRSGSPGNNTTFQFYSDMALNNLVHTGSTYTFSPNTTTRIYVTEIINGCRSQAGSVQITVNIPPSPPVLTAISPICVGGTIPQLRTNNPGSGNTVQWFNVDPRIGNPSPVRTGNTFNPPVSNMVVDTTTYWVRVRNNSTGCTSEVLTISVIVISQPPAPVVAMDTVQSCIGDTITIFKAIGSGGNLNWYNMDPTIGNPTAISTGANFKPPVDSNMVSTNNFWVLESYTAGCRGPATPVQLSFNAIKNAPTLAASVVNICPGDPVPALSAAGSGDTLNWYDADPSTGVANLLAVGNVFAPVINNATPGIYNFWVTETNDNGCGSLANSAQVNVRTAPPRPTAGANAAICAGAAIPTLTATGNGGTINWYNSDPAIGNPITIANGNSFTPVVNNNTAASYQFWITQTDANACESAASTISLTINSLPNAPTVAAPSPICVGAAIPTLTATGINITWYNSDPTVGNPAPVATGNSFTPAINNALAGSYTFWATQTNANNCSSAAATAVLVVNAPPSAPALNAPTPICAGEAIPTLTATGSNLNWYNSDPSSGAVAPIATGNTFSPAINNSTPGNYTFFATQTDANGCEGTASTVSIVINALPGAPQAASDQQICIGEAIPNLTANGASGTLNWYNSNPAQGNPTPIFVGTSISPVIDNTTPGSYTFWITETNASGCEGSADSIRLVVNAQLDAPQIVAVTPICTGETVPTLSANGGGGTLSWYDSDPALGNVSPLANGSTFLPTINNSVAGSYRYWVTETSSSGCESAAAQVALLINAPPNAPQINSVQPICAGDAIPTLTVSGAGGNLIWYNTDPGIGNPTPIANGASFTPTLNSNQAGNFTFWVVEDNGCISNPSNTTLIINALPGAPQAVAPQPICANTNIPTLTATGTGINWYDTDPTSGNPSAIANGASFVPNLNSSIAGSFTFFATQTDANGCEGAATAIILLINALPNAPQSPGDAQICVNEAVPAFTINNAMGTIRWYNSDPATGNPSAIAVGTVFTPGVSNALAGNYNFWFALTDSNGCSSAATAVNLTVNALPSEPGIAAPQPICEGEAIPALVATGSNIDWYNADPALNNSIPVGNGNNFIPNISGTGNFTFWAIQTDANNCSSLAASVSLTINGLPSNPTVVAPQPICAGAEIPSILADGIGTLAWYDVDPNNQITNPIASGASFKPILDNTQPGTFDFWVSATSAEGCQGPFTTTSLTIHALPSSPSSIDPTEICEGFAIPTLTIAPIGNATIDWYDAAMGGSLLVQNSASFTPLSAGTYFVESRDVTTGCVSNVRTAITLIEYDNPTLAIENITQPGCNLTNGAVTLNAVGSGILQFSIDNGSLQSNNTFSALGAGEYRFFVQDENGCRDTITTLLVAPNGVLANAGDDATLTCINPTATIDGSGSVGPTGFTYEWLLDGNIISSDASFAATQGGTYILRVTFENCTDVDTIFVENKIRDIAAAIQSGGTLTCVINSINLDGSASTTGASIVYEWHLNNTPLANANANSLTATQAGSYQLIVTDSESGCTNTASAEVMENRTLPQVSAGNDVRLDCRQPSAILVGSSSGGVPETFQWFDEAGSQLAATLNLSVTTAGTYTLRVTRTDNGCLAEDEVFITADFQAPIADAGNDTQLDCDVTEVTIGGVATSQGADFQYLWTVNGSNTAFDNNARNPIITEPGIYNLLVTNTRNGCTATDEVLVQQFLPDNLNFEVLISPPTCKGLTDARIQIIPLDNSATFLYAFDGQALSQARQFSNIPPGTYHLLAQDAFGCEWDTTVTINAITPVKVEAGDNIAIRLGDQLQLDARVNLPMDMIAEINWSLSELLSCKDCLNPVADSLSGITTFRISVKDINGCTDEDAVTVYVSKERRVFIPNAFTPDNDGSNDVFMIYGGNDVRSVKSFQIFNRWGEKVYEDYNFQPNDPARGWGGQMGKAGVGKPLDPAVFVFFAEIEFIDDKVEIFKGDVVLVR